MHQRPVIKTLGFRSLVLFLTGLFVLTWLFPLQPVRANGIFFVDSAMDNAVKDTELTLREAIVAANGANPSRVYSDAEKAALTGCTFSGTANNWIITGGCGAGVQDTISLVDNLHIILGSSLPTLTDESTYIGPLPGVTVKIDGNNVANNIFRISATDTMIDSLILYGTTGSIIKVEGGAVDVWIKNSVIGDDSAGSGGCGQSPHATNGIEVTGGSRATISGNVIECIASGPGFGVSIFGSNSSAIYDNTIAHNANCGVYLSGADDNEVYGNVIEQNAASGVALRAGSFNNQIGCPPGGPNNATYRNQIRLNSLQGIQIADSGTAANFVGCNWIGLTADGAGAAGNRFNGVRISGGASANVIGQASTGNVISGNGSDGIQIVGSGTNGNLVYGNYVGTNVDGNAAVGNGLSGVAIFAGAKNNTVGDKLSSARLNVISGNERNGVFIGDAGTSGNRLHGNLIGPGMAYEGQHVPNGWAGVTIKNADGNVVGSADGTVWQSIGGNLQEGIYIENADNTFVNLMNHINYNGAAAVAVVGDSDSNDIWPTSVGASGGLPIDLGNDGHTPNDPGDGDSGPNRLLNYPEITNVAGSVVQGTVCPGCFVRIYRASGDPSAPSGGGYYVRSVAADGSGNWSADLAADGLQHATQISLVAVQSFRTSEMSPRWKVRVFLPLVVRD